MDLGCFGFFVLLSDDVIFVFGDKLLVFMLISNIYVYIFVGENIFDYIKVDLIVLYV